MRRSRGVGHCCLRALKFLRQLFDQALRPVLPLRLKDAGNPQLATIPGRFVQKPFGLRCRSMRRDVGLRGRSDVELQSPAAVAIRRRTPQIHRADLGQPSVQPDGNRARLPATARPQHGADRRQRRHLFPIDGDQLAGPIGQTQARHPQRELHRLGDQQSEQTVGHFDRLTRLGAARHQAHGRGLIAFDANVVAACQVRGDAYALATPHHAEVGGAAGDRQVQPVVVQNDRGPVRLPLGLDTNWSINAISRCRSTGEAKNPPLNSTISGRMPAGGLWSASTSPAARRWAVRNAAR